MPTPEDRFRTLISIDPAFDRNIELAIARKKKKKKKLKTKKFNWKMVRIWGSRDDDDDDNYRCSDCGHRFYHGEWGWNRYDVDEGYYDYVCKKCRGVEHDKAIANDGGED